MTSHLIIITCMYVCASMLSLTQASISYVTNQLNKIVCFDDIWCRLLNKNEHVIRSKLFFLKVSFLAFLSLHTEEEAWPDGTHPMLFAESSCVCTLKF